MSKLKTSAFAATEDSETAAPVFRVLPQLANLLMSTSSHLLAVQQEMMAAALSEISHTHATLLKAGNAIAENLPWRWPQSSNSARAAEALRSTWEIAAAAQTELLALFGSYFSIHWIETETASVDSPVGGRSIERRIHAVAVDFPERRMAAA